MRSVPECITISMEDGKKQITIDVFCATPETGWSLVRPTNLKVSPHVPPSDAVKRHLEYSKR